MGKFILRAVFMLLMMAAAVFIPIFCAWNYGEKKYNEKMNRIENTIGQEVVLRDDTLMVVSYQRGDWGHPRGYVLSNGLVVDEKILRDLEK